MMGHEQIVKRLALNKTKIAMLDKNLNRGHQKMSHDSRDDVMQGFLLSAYFCISLQPITLTTPSQKHTH
jgi:hypothetical protein